MKVPFFTNKYQDELYGKEVREKIDEIIKTGIFIGGDEIVKLEDNIKKYTGAKNAIGVANGSDALYLSVLSLDLPKNSEVITTPFTFFSSTSCITRNNLKPVFIDVNEDTYNINAEKIEEKITKNTKCILTVDLFSQACDYRVINQIAEKHNLKIVEDSAEAFGMKYNGKSAGILGDIGVLSFFPTKTLSCFGDGGMVITNNDELSAKVRILKNHGASKKYFHKYVGIISRLDNLQAGILNIKLKYIDKEIKHREKISKLYFERLKELQNIKLPVVIKNADPVWYVFTIQCQKRNELQVFLKQKEIETTIYYPQAMHLQECFTSLGYKKGDFPVAEKLCENSLALPVFYGMEENLVNYIADNIISFYKGK